MSYKLMSRDEIVNVLSRAWHGVLSLVDGDRPYSIPMAHVLYRGNIYFLLLREGRKTACLERNKNVCYLVYLEESGACCSILVEGELEKVRDERIIRDIVKIFCEKVFPRDPYFEGVRCEEIVKLSIEHPRVGLYRLNIRSISGIRKTRAYRA